MKKKDHLGKKVHESKFYETFICTFSASFPMVPLTPPLVASDPATEFCPFCIAFFVPLYKFNKEKLTLYKMQYK